MRDITEEEEHSLPLPFGWGGTITTSVNGGKGLMYKQIRTGLVVEEHPYINQALNVARKLPLSEGWSIKEAFLSDGTKDYFYTNNRMGISCWDPPLLRQCLSDVLGANGHSAESVWILKGDGPPSSKTINPTRSGTTSNMKPNNEELTGRRMQSVGEAYQQFKKSGEVQLSSNPTNPAKSYTPMMEASNSLRNSIAPARDVSMPLHNNVDQTSGHDVAARSPSREKEKVIVVSATPSKWSIPASAQAIDPSANDNGYSSSFSNLPFSSSQLHPPPPPFTESARAPEASSPGEDQSVITLTSSIPSIAGVRSRSEKWEALRHNMTKETIPPDVPLTHTTERSAPPKSSAGIKILKQDVIDANLRVHELMIRLRTVLCGKEDMACRVMDFNIPSSRRQFRPDGGLEDKSVDTSNIDGSKCTIVVNYSSAEMLSLAADIMQELRHNPEHIICAMACCTPGSGNGMSQIAFSAINRLLHPFSTDSTMTTALLLQGINYQVEECAHLETLFPELDPKRLLSRAMFIADPTIALGWNPLAQPLPVIPAVPSETVLICLLRMYGVRRDVTSFFRTVWRPIIPQVMRVVSSHEIDGANTFANLTSVAYRLIEVSLSEKVTMLFPPVATAMCRAMFAIGGMDAMHTYIFNLLILPNLLKIFNGAHDSVESEAPVRFDSMEDYSVKYYDIDAWWPADGFDSAPFSALGTLVWIAWRFYSAASMIENKTLAVLTSKDFFMGGPRLDMTSVPDSRLRSIIWHLQRRLDEGCQRLLKMPLDALGNEFLGIDSSSHLNGLANVTSARALEQRLSALLLKPEEMLGLSVVGRHELANLFSDVGIAMEAVGSAHDSHGFAPLHRAITEYLVINDDFSEEVGEELLMISFSSIGETDKDKLSFEQTEEGIAYKYKQLLRGLRLANRYEDSLIRMIKDAERQSEVPMQTSILTLIEDESIFVNPEFDADCKIVRKVGISSRHTKNSRYKVKENLHGLDVSQKILVHPSSLPFDALEAPGVDVDWHEDKSSRQIFDNAHTALRFHSSHASVAVNASIARPTHHKPKLPDHSALIQQARGQDKSAMQRTKRGHTRVTVHPESGFLKHTVQFTQHQKEEKYQPPCDYTKMYVESLRTDSAIPTERFLRKRNNRISQARGPSNPNNSSVETRMKRDPKPFPEHLRYRIRNPQPSSSESRDVENGGEAGLDEDTQYSEDDFEQLDQDFNESKREYEHDDQGDDENEAANEDKNGENSPTSQDEVRALLSDYYTIFGQAGAKMPALRVSLPAQRASHETDSQFQLRSQLLHKDSPSKYAINEHSDSYRQRRAFAVNMRSQLRSQSPDNSQSPPRPQFHPAGILDLERHVYHHDSGKLRSLAPRPDLPVEGKPGPIGNSEYSTLRLTTRSNSPPTARGRSKSRKSSSGDGQAEAKASAMSRVSPSVLSKKRKSKPKKDAENAPTAPVTRKEKSENIIDDARRTKDEASEETKDPQDNERDVRINHSTKTSSLSPPQRRMSTMQWLFNSAISPVATLRKAASTSPAATSGAQSGGDNTADAAPSVPAKTEPVRTSIPTVSTTRRATIASPSLSPTPAPPPAPAMLRPVRQSLVERKATLEAARAARSPDIRVPSRTPFSPTIDAASFAFNPASVPAPTHTSPPVSSPTNLPSPRSRASISASISSPQQAALVALHRQSFTVPLETEENCEPKEAQSPPLNDTSENPSDSKNAAGGGPSQDPAPSTSSPKKPPVIKKASQVIRDKDILLNLLVSGVKIVKVCQTCYSLVLH